MCRRVTRSTLRPNKSTDPIVTVTPPIPLCELSSGDLAVVCSTCKDPVSPDLTSVQCGFCGLYRHAQCDETLTVRSAQMVRDARHPSICYRCPDCRTTKTHAVEIGDSMDTRVQLLENQVKDLIALVQGLSQTSQKRDGISASKLTKIKACHRNDVLDQITAVDMVGDSKEVRRKTKSSSTSLSKRKEASKVQLSVICTNVTESGDTLLANRHGHDIHQWHQLCSRMNLQPITPVSLTRLNRKPDSPHHDKPRLLRLVVEKEKDLEDILLSAYLLRDENNDTSRIFADVPWSERVKSSSKGGQNSIIKPDERSLIILNVPESASTINTKSGTQHDLQQWQYIGRNIQATNVAVVNLFRIPKSPKYEGNGPRPLKLTLLTTAMADSVYKHWRDSRQKLPREIRIIRGSPKRPHGTMEPSIADAHSNELTPKNASLPAPVESAI